MSDDHILKRVIRSTLCMYRHCTLPWTLYITIDAYDRRMETHFTRDGSQPTYSMKRKELESSFGRIDKENNMRGVYTLDLSQSKVYLASIVLMLVIIQLGVTNAHGRSTEIFCAACIEISSLPLFVMTAKSITKLGQQCTDRSTSESPGSHRQKHSQMLFTEIQKIIIIIIFTN